MRLRVPVVIEPPAVDILPPLGEAVSKVAETSG